MQAKAIRRAAAVGAVAVAVIMVASGCMASSAAGPPSPVSHDSAIRFLSSPSVPLKGAAATYVIRAQYPVVTAGFAGANRAARRRLDLAMQQPIIAWVNLVTRDAMADRNLGIGRRVAPGSTIPGAVERTVVIRAGRIVTVKYIFRAGSKYSGDAGGLVVLRIGTGQLVPPGQILTRQAAAMAGASMIAAEINRIDPQAGPCPGVTEQDIGPYLFRSDPTSEARMQLGVQLGVTSTGIEFFVDPGAQECYRQDVVVPFSLLSGLVMPALQQLATVKAAPG